MVKKQKPKNPQKTNLSEKKKKESELKNTS